MMDDIHICFSVSKDCKNMMDSYGEICVGCNCCGRIDKATMYDCQIKTYSEQLKEFAEHLNDDVYEEYQKRNCASTIISFANMVIDAINAKEQEAHDD